MKHDYMKPYRMRSSGTDLWCICTHPYCLWRSFHTRDNTLWNNFLLWLEWRKHNRLAHPKGF